MNRAEKTSAYIEKRVKMLERLEDLKYCKTEFFVEIQRFREETVQYLRSVRIIKPSKLDELYSILAEIESYKTKGGSDVYWPRVGPAFKKTIVTLEHLASYSRQDPIPLHLRLKDYLSDESFIKNIILLIIGSVLGAIVTYFLSNPP